MHLIRGSTWFQIVNARLASLEWILCNAVSVVRCRQAHRTDRICFSSVESLPAVIASAPDAIAVQPDLNARTSSPPRRRPRPTW